MLDNFHICTVHLDIIKVFYSPTNAQVIVLKNNIKIYIKIALDMFPVKCYKGHRSQSQHWDH